MLLEITYNRTGIIKLLNLKEDYSTMEIRLEGKGKKYIELYQKIVDMINDNTLKPNEKLPSKRDLALDLNLSINTIITSYNMLLDEGYIYSIEKKGYYVTKQPIMVKKPKEIINKESIIKDDYIYDFTTSKIEAFSKFNWIKTLKQITDSTNYLNKTDSFGLVSLRDEIRMHLKENRGINTSIDNIIICNGLDIFERILNLLDINDLILENPGYHKLAKLNINKKISYQALDDEGILIPNKRAILYTTPFSQFPTGIKMSIKRKKELINYCNNTKSIIIEDDFDSEFRINGQRSISLYSLDNDKVIFFSSFTTTMYPGLRIAYVILPDRLLNIYKEKYISYSPFPTLEQLALKEFIKSGFYASHINRMKKTYIKKRQLIIKLLKDIDFIEIDDKKSYLSIPIKIKTHMSDNEIKNILKQNKIKAFLLSDYDIYNKDSKTIILGYSAIEYDKILDGINLLVESLKK